jgi:hypothetical protein
VNPSTACAWLGLAVGREIEGSLERGHLGADFPSGAHYEELPVALNEFVTADGFTAASWFGRKSTGYTLVFA